jgi:putative MATE family efflux protein
MLTAIKNRYIGDKEFYRKLIVIVLPIIIQNTITNFVNLLDNIMVGQVGTDQMSGVAIANQILMIFFLAIFGAMSGAGIFTAQFYGKGDYDGVRHTFMIKFLIGIVILLIGALVYGVWGKDLMSLYLTGEGDSADPVATLEYADKYLKVIMISFIPIVMTNVYTSTMRESGETVIPMASGIVAVIINLVFNYFLIFGRCGFPKLGVVGAAIATTLSRYIEMSIAMFAGHLDKKKYPYFVHAYRSIKIPVNLLKNVIIKGTPLLVNETLWSFGIATLTQCYSVKGINVIASLNISQTISQLFNVVFMSMGNAVAIIIGQKLGANKFDEAKKDVVKLMFAAVFSCFVMGALLYVAAPVFPGIYNTSADIKSLATKFIRICAFCMPLFAFMHCSYFTLRSGGKTIITFLFDSCYVWVISIPLAFVLTRFTGLPIVPIYFICNFIDIMKCILGYVLLKKGVWINNVVNE